MQSIAYIPRGRFTAIWGDCGIIPHNSPQNVLGGKWGHWATRDEGVLGLFGAIHETPEKGGIMNYKVHKCDKDVHENTVIFYEEASNIWWLTLGFDSCAVEFCPFCGVALREVETNEDEQKP